MFPDPCGLAVRFDDLYGPDAHQDFLLVSSANRPIGRHLLAPARGFAECFYSSLLPYRVGTDTVLVGARPKVPERGLKLADLQNRSAADLGFVLVIADPTGTWREVGDLRLTKRVEPEEAERLRFNPANSGGAIKPVGFFNALRPSAYRGSQLGWTAPKRSRGGASAASQAALRDG